jgi:protein gp37
MKDTLIGWSHHTINFWLGCNRADSAECEGCYAEAQMIRYGQNFNVLRPTRDSWYEAERLNAGAEARGTHELVFTCSLSDFFHQGADIWREEAWDVIRRCRNLIWLILTKRPQRILEHLPADWDDGKGYRHVWLGVTCGTNDSSNRIAELRKVPCALRFLSCEPLLQDISKNSLEGIGWVLCGGMSGPLYKERPMDLRWAAALYQKAHSAGIPFLFKQVSHNLTERGINALGLFLGQLSGNPADPEIVDCVREYPKLSVPFTPPEPKGVRWSKQDWAKYLRHHPI